MTKTVKIYDMETDKFHEYKLNPDGSALGDYDVLVKILDKDESIDFPFWWTLAAVLRMQRDVIDSKRYG